MSRELLDLEVGIREQGPDSSAPGHEYPLTLTIETDRPDGLIALTAWEDDHLAGQMLFRPIDLWQFILDNPT